MDLLVQDSIWICLCWLGVFSVRGSNNRQLQQHQEKVLFHLWKLGIHPSSLLLLYCYLLFWHLLSVQFQLWTLDWRNISCNFWVLRFVSCGYNLPFIFTSILHFWAWVFEFLALLMRMSSGIPLAQFSCFPLCSDMALECYLQSLGLLWPS